MPINDTGYTLTVGPDVNGQFFDVPPGGRYKTPTPPRGVDDPAPEQSTDAPEAKPKGDKEGTKA